MIAKAYKRIVNKYVKRFLRKHEFFDETNGEYSYHRWIGNEVGGALEIADYVISFEDIRLDIDAETDKNVYFEYYDYVVEGGNNVNYRSYLMGVK